MGTWGVFMETTTIFNRAPVALSVRFDGESKVIHPGENTGFPKVAVPYARKQNPIMGTQSFNNPTASGYESLIVDMNSARKSEREKAVSLTDEEWEEHLAAPSNLRVSEIEEERGVKLRLGRKTAKPVMASSFEAREGGAAAEFDGLDQRDAD